MLNRLVINNIALIESAEIEFNKGLNVLSGETGSGKSVILDSLNFVLGAKADKTLIRNGENECFVLAEFDVSDNAKIKETYLEMDIEPDDTLIISRKYSIDGKNLIKLNGNTINVSMLKKFTSLLVDVHGQSEHFELLSNSNQLKLIDKFGGEEIGTLKEKIKEEYSKYKSILKNLEQLGGDESQRLLKLDILNFQIKEIEDLSLGENEEENLKEIRSKLLNQEKILTSLNSVKSAIKDEGSASDCLSGAIKVLSSISNLSDEYMNLYSRLYNSFSEIEDVSDSIDNILDGFDGEEYNLDEIEERLDKIKKNKSKYGNDYVEINKFLENAKTEKEKLENFNEYAGKLLTEKEKEENILYKQYISLSNLRKKASEVFTKNVSDELTELGMNKAVFKVDFDEIPSKSECKFDSANGIDNVVFYFSANLGEPVKPLSMVISGGEMSRFMLAIKAQSAKYNDISTYIFDEIDAGISGAIATVVAKKLNSISKFVQVISISHLPQIVSFADNNVLILKKEQEDKTLTSVIKLDEKTKVDEIIRLVGGNKDSDSARTLANELIAFAKDYKQNN